MPSISAHMIVAKLVGEKLNITSDDFIRGNLLPDVIDIKDSHHKIQSRVYLVPDITYHLQNLDLNDDLSLGVLVHLLLDKHYLEDYLEKLYPNRNIFLDGKIYEDYNYLNYELVNKFNLDVHSLEQVLTKYNCNILEEKLKYNIECLKQKKEGKTRYLELDSFSKFLSDVSDVISKELVDYENKSSKLLIHIR